MFSSGKTILISLFVLMGLSADLEPIHVLTYSYERNFLPHYVKKKWLK